MSDRIKNLNFWKAIILSFYSKEFYQQVKNAGAAVIIFFMCIYIPLWIVKYIIHPPALYTTFQQHFVEIFDQIPTLTIHNGKLSTPEKKPYIIIDKDTNSIFAVIDTSGKYKTLEQANTTLLLTEDSMIQKGKDNKISTSRIPKDFNYTIHPATIKNIIINTFRGTWFIWAPILSIFAFMFTLVQILIFAFVGKIFAKLFNIALSYNQMLSLTIVAMVPVTIILFFLKIFKFNVPFLLYFSLVFAYMLFSMISVAESA